MLGKLTRLALLGSFGVFSACETPSPTASAGAGPDREMGSVEAIYPHLAASGEWLLEYRLTADTVFVDYETSRDRVRDPAWKEALTTRKHVFFDNGEGCMYTPAVSGCLPFLVSPPAAGRTPAP